MLHVFEHKRANETKSIYYVYVEGYLGFQWLVSFSIFSHYLILGLYQMNTQMIETHHEEIIHDITFDYYGNRFATCSSDQTVKIYQRTDAGNWVKESELKCHDGPVWRVKWAHPKFGSVIATCSQDKAVCVWEEKKQYEDDQQSKQNQQKIKSQWQQRAYILESKESVQDIKFGSRYQGLILAIAFADGKLQIYRMLEHHNLTQFLMVGEVNAMAYGIRSISWNKCAFDREMIAVGGNTQLQGYKKPLDQVDKPVDRAQAKYNPPPQQQEISLEKKEAPAQVPTLTIYGKEDKGSSEQTYNWVVLRHFEQFKTVNDVSWSNLNGRSFHLIASADESGINIWRFGVKDKQLNIIDRMSIDQMAEQAWRVSWNLMATLVAASYRQEEIRVYKNLNSTWICQGTLSEQQEKVEIKENV